MSLNININLSNNNEYDFQFGTLSFFSNILLITNEKIWNILLEMEKIVKFNIKRITFLWFFLDSIPNSGIKNWIKINKTRLF